eukprot:11013421-Ditylum_brightwellii.AAC.1
MKDDYNFLIQAYRISNPKDQFKGFNTTLKGTEHQQGGDGYMLKSKQSAARPEVMKLLKDSFNDEI